MGRETCRCLTHSDVLGKFTALVLLPAQGAEMKRKGDTKMADETDLFNEVSDEDETCSECGELLEDCDCDCDEEEEDEDAE